MSRIGRMPVVIPAGVTVDVRDGNVVTVKGAKGELTRQFAPEMKITVQEVEKEIDETQRSEERKIPARTDPFASAEHGHRSQ